MLRLHPEGLLRQMAGLALTMVLVSACANSDGGIDGTGGSGAEGGSTGTGGGSGGTVGSGGHGTGGSATGGSGSGGVTGTGGSAGAKGTGGATGGTTGSGGAAGAKGTGGATGGTTGSGGAAGAKGTGGATGGTTGTGGAAGAGTGGSAGAGGASIQTGTPPGDIAAAAGTPLVAGHSVTRALYAAYSGKLFQARRASDSKTQDINTVGAGGFVDLTALSTFCSGTTCTVSILYDQAGNGNDMSQAAAGSQPTIGFWASSSGPSYPMIVSKGYQWLRNRTSTKKIPTGSSPQTEY